jgi:O-antigen/teichoic acid export membrane protein
LITQTKNQLRRLLPKNAFARGVSVLVGGTASAQILLVLAAPLLTRLYKPEDFGLLAVYASLLALIGVVSSLRYELAIPLPEDDGEAANVAALSLILVGASTVLTGILVALLGPVIADALGVPGLSSYLWLLPVGVLMSGAYTVFNYWAIRTKRFSTIASTKLRQAIATIAIQLAAFKLGIIALLFGQVAGQGVGTTALGRPALDSAGFKQVSWGGIWRAAGRYRRFPIFSTWGGFVDTASTRLPMIFLFGVFGASAAGFLSIAERVLHMPASLLGGAIHQVFLSNAPEANRMGELRLLVQKVSSKLIHIGLPPAVLIFLVGPDLFSLAFGESWRQAGVFASWMIPWIYFQFISSPLSMIFAVVEKMEQSLMWQFMLLVSNILALAIGISINDLLMTIIMLSVFNSSLYIILLIWIARLSDNSVIVIFRPMIFSSLAAFFCSIPVLVIKLGFNNDTGLLGVAFVASILLVAARYFQLSVYKSD